MKKINIGKKPFIYPMPITIVGTRGEVNPNFMAVGWITPVNYNPPMIGIALGKSHYTNQAIKEEKAFSVNIPHKRLIDKTDYCGLVSGHNEDKSTLFEVFYEGHPNIPMIKECPITIQCKLHSIIDMPSNEFFIGEVLNTFVDDDCLVDNMPDITKISPFTLSMPDNQYWGIGNNLGKAWSIGRNLKP